MKVVLIRGTGDIGSAVAHELFRNGHRVVMHDAERPAHTRRGMAFTDAVYERKAQLAGVIAKRAPDQAFIHAMLGCGRAIAVSIAAFDELVEFVHPDVLVDARMRKRARPEPQRGLARLTVGLGPNFVAGEMTDVVIETSWGESLGNVITSGASLPLAGEPREIAGFRRERYVYAPAAGVFCTQLQIGATVEAGQAIAMIGEAVLHAPLGGRLRGLTHDGAWVDAATKVIEIDPRAQDAQIFGISERPAKIAAGVIDAISARRLAG